MENRKTSFTPRSKGDRSKAQLLAEKATMAMEKEKAVPEKAATLRLRGSPTFDEDLLKGGDIAASSSNSSTSTSQRRSNRVVSRSSYDESNVNKDGTLKGEDGFAKGKSKRGDEDDDDDEFFDEGDSGDELANNAKTAKKRKTAKQGKATATNKENKMPNTNLQLSTMAQSIAAPSLWSPEEDAILYRLRTAGHTWAAIDRTGELPGRNQITIRNRWVYKKMQMPNTNLQLSTMAQSRAATRRWSPEEDAILYRLRTAGLGWVDIERTGELPGRNQIAMSVRWNITFVEKDESPLNEGDVKHVLRNQRDSNHSNKWTKYSKDINRDSKRIRHMYMQILTGAKDLDYLDEEEQFVIEPEGDAFEAQVQALMPIVKKLDRSKAGKNNAETNVAAALSSETVSKSQAEFEKKQKKKQKKEAKRATKAEKEKKLKEMRITPEEKKKLADENCEEEWVKEHRAREKMLIESGVSKELLDEIFEHYNSKLDEGDMVASSGNSLLWQPPRYSSGSRVLQG